MDQMVSTMQALVCRVPGDLALESRERPGKPQAGWARLAVSHVGICGTDYHIFEGKHPFLNYPRIMGHEVSAKVVEAGDGVALSAGETVIVNPYLACGTCIACRNGKANCCVAIQVLGVHRDGAMCEEILVPASNLYPAGGPVGGGRGDGRVSCNRCACGAAGADAEGQPLAGHRRRSHRSRHRPIFAHCRT